MCSAHAHVKMARAQGSSAVQQRAETGADGGGAATVARAARVDPGTPARSMTASASLSPSTAGASGATMRALGEDSAMAAVADAVQRAKLAKVTAAPKKRKRKDADADEAALRSLIAELITILSSQDPASKELKQAVNIIQFTAYKGHKAKHLDEMFAHLVTPAHEAVAATLRTVVRGLCAELAPGIRNVREGTHDNASLRLHAAQSRVCVRACRRASYEDGAG